MKKSKQHLKHSTQTTAQSTSIMPLILLSLYFVVEIIAIKGQIDYKGFHWLGVSMLNVVSLGYIFINRKGLQLTNRLYTRNILLILLGVFFVLSGISMLSAFNIAQSMMAYTTLATMVTMVFVFYTLLYQRLDILKKLAVVIAAITLYETFSIMSGILGGIAHQNIHELIKLTKGTMGNQNVLAFSLAVKIPFIIYAAISSQKTWLKIGCAVSVWLAFLTLFFTLSRAAFGAIIFQLVLFLGGMGYLLFKQNKKKFLYQSLSLVALFMSAFIVYQAIYSNARRPHKANKEATAAFGKFERKSVKEEIRWKYWSHSIDLIKEKPLTGYGIGNYEFYIPLYYNQLANGNKFSRHPHNEFVNIAAESGIVNSLVYLSIFVMALLLVIKILTSEDKVYPPEAKWMALAGIVALAGYFVDSSFNFPISRPPMQVLYACIIGLLAAIYHTYRPSEKTVTANNLRQWVSILSIGLGIIGIATVYVNYTVYKSFKIQGKIVADLSRINKNAETAPQYTYDELIKELPSFPNIAEDTEPIGYKLARYLTQEKRYDEAIACLDSIHQYSPYTAYDYYLKSNVYNRKQEIDSAYKYVKKAYLIRPRNLNYYKTAMGMAVKTEHIEDIDTFYETYQTYNHHADAFFIYVSSLIRTKHRMDEIKTLIKEGAEKYPRHQKLQQLNRKLNGI